MLGSLSSDIFSKGNTRSHAATDVDFLELLQVVPKASLLAAQNAHRRASTPNFDS
jgi:hypothetical protein